MARTSPVAVRPGPRQETPHAGQDPRDERRGDQARAQGHAGDPRILQLAVAGDLEAAAQDRDHHPRLDGEEQARPDGQARRERPEQLPASFALQELLQLGRRREALQQAQLQLHAQPRSVLQAYGHDPYEQAQHGHLTERQHHNLPGHRRPPADLLGSVLPAIHTPAEASWLTASARSPVLVLDRSPNGPETYGKLAERVAST